MPPSKGGQTTPKTEILPPAYLQLLVKESPTALPGSPQEVMSKEIMETTHYLPRNFHLLGDL